MPRKPGAIHCLIILFLLAFNASAEPIPVKNHSPVWFGLLSPVLETASTVETGKFTTAIEFDYSNILFFNGKDDWIKGVQGWQTRFDMEIFQVTLDLRLGTPVNGLEVGLSQPFYHLSSGFMDRYIIGLHSATGISDYPGKRRSDINKYLYYFEHDGFLWNAPSTNRFTHGDTSLWVKKEIANSDDRLLSLKFIAQPPVASTTSGLGNGAWEYSLVFLMDHNGDLIDTTINAGIVDPGYINRGEYWDLEQFEFLQAAITYNVTARTSAVVQGTIAITSPYDVPLPVWFQKTWREITFGFVYLTKSDKKIYFGFLEDLSGTGPDFTIHLSFSN